MPSEPAPPPRLLRPEWPAPPQVGAAMSLRDGGVSPAPWDSLNLGGAVGDAPDNVAENRRRFAQAIDAQPQWLALVHGADCVRLHAAPPAQQARADAAWTDVPGVACTVGAADCLPVLFAAPAGRGVAAAHAGWRGLAAGVLRNTVAALCEGTGCAPADLLAWLGPCIGPHKFEVGLDVLQAYGASPAGDPARFVPRPNAQGQMRWLANLPRLAIDQLQAAGVQRISGGSWCTVSQPADFFSYRRDGITGRMACAVWLHG